MADEAVLRIVLQDDGSSTPSTVPSSVTPQPNQSTQPVVPVGGTKQPPAVNTPGQPPQTPSNVPVQPQVPTQPNIPASNQPPSTPAVPVPPVVPQPTTAPAQKPFDPYAAILKMADSLRGTIGGAFGVLVGAVVDVASAVYKARQQVNLANTPLPPPLTPAAPSQLPANVNPPTVPTNAPPPPPPGKTGPAQASQHAASNIAPPPQPGQPPAPPTPPVVPVGAAAGAGGGGGAALAAAAPYVLVFTVAVVAATKAVEALVNQIHKAEDQYSQYSPAIAQAQAYEDVRRVMGDLRRAQEIGPEMAKYIRSRADLEQKYEDLKVKLLMKIMPAVTRGVEELEKFLDIIGPVMEMVEYLSVLTKIADEIRKKLLDDDKEEPLPEDPTKMIFGGSPMTFDTGVGKITVKTRGVEIPTE